MTSRVHTPAHGVPSPDERNVARRRDRGERERSASIVARAVYNEIDPYAAQWLRNLIAVDHIAPGVVDERSIVEIKPAELLGGGQRHFFAGIGIWSHALRLAGWPDDVPVWTGSCPCQPFSAAGKRGGFGDERHLWPVWFELIRECRPDIVLGEQVSSPDGLGWFDAVSADLEGAGYAVGALDTCAAGVGAPHIRQRLYWVAYAGGQRLDGVGLRVPRRGQDEDGAQADGGSEDRERVGNAAAARRGHPEDAGADHGNAGAGARGRESRRAGENGLADAMPAGRPERRSAAGDRSPARGSWDDVIWIDCTDGKRRPTQPGIEPLAHGAPARVGRLRAYGNGLCAPQAAAFIGAVMDVLPSPSCTPGLDERARARLEAVVLELGFGDIPGRGE